MRLSWFKRWLARAKELAPFEKELHRSMPHSRAAVLQGKRIVLDCAGGSISEMDLVSLQDDALINCRFAIIQKESQESLMTAQLRVSMPPFRRLNRQSRNPRICLEVCCLAMLEKFPADTAFEGKCVDLKSIVKCQLRTRV